MDESNQANGGPAASVVGDIGNGTDTASYVFLRRRHVYTTIVTADAKGRLWLMVGTDSGFEGTTGLYYRKINVSLTPVE